MGFELKVNLNEKKIEELKLALGKLSGEIAEEYLEDVRAADVIPILSGALYKSLKARKTEDWAVIESGLPYAELRYHVNPKNPDKTLWFERVDSTPAVKRVLAKHKGDLG